MSIASHRTRFSCRRPSGVESTSFLVAASATTASHKNRKHVSMSRFLLVDSMTPVRRSLGPARVVRLHPFARGGTVRLGDVDVLSVSVARGEGPTQQVEQRPNLILADVDELLQASTSPAQQPMSFLVLLDPDFTELTRFQGVLEDEHKTRCILSSTTIIVKRPRCADTRIPRSAARSEHTLGGRFSGTSKSPRACSPTDASAEQRANQRPRQPQQSSQCSQAAHRSNQDQADVLEAWAPSGRAGVGGARRPYRAY